MRKIMAARRALIERIVEGAGTASRSRRRAAFENSGVEAPLATLVTKVASHPHEITDEDILGALASGSSEDEIFEVVICGAVGAAVRQHDSALRALEAAVRAGE
jgi:hypothetical protein